MDIPVVILAGGKGTRLHPHTSVFPKPLVPLGETPILEVVIHQLKAHGFKRIILAVNHLSELIKTYFGDGSKFDVEISYYQEKEPLGTAGCLGLIEGLNEDFLVMNGDLLTTLNYKKLMENHLSNQAVVTIGTFERDVHIDFGVLDLSKDGKLEGYIEKPTRSYTVSMGVYAMNKKVLKFIKKDTYLDIPTLMINLLKSKFQVQSFQSDCEWLDIGRPDDYERAQVVFERDKDKYLI